MTTPSMKCPPSASLACEYPADKRLGSSYNATTVDGYRKGEASKGPRAPKLDYQPALDGIRALAILAVLLFHGGIVWLPGGFLGVDVFFALSGYLITSLLINEYLGSGVLNLKRFFQSRARRLLPALLTMVLMVATYSTLFINDSVASTWRDLPWVVNGLSN